MSNANIVPDERTRLNRGWIRIAVLALILSVAILAKAAFDYKRTWYLTFNWTESLPNWAFVIDRGAAPSVGDFIDFWPPENPYYQGISFVKQIVAGPGDMVECKDRSFIINDVVVATAKPISQKGDVLSMGPCGEVPADNYFVIAPHKDSFDSRYGEIGYVSIRRIRGVATPVL